MMSQLSSIFKILYDAYRFHDNLILLEKEVIY
jgi:hypothetical protein